MTNDTVLRSTTFVNTHVKFHLYWNPLIDKKTNIAQKRNGIEWELVNVLYDAYVRLGILQQYVVLWECCLQVILCFAILLWPRIEECIRPGQIDSGPEKHLRTPYLSDIFSRFARKWNFTFLNTFGGHKVVPVCSAPFILSVYLYT